nr:XrtA system polysaccharide deacetylase [uncultured Niameybacter sp.]
MKNILCVDLEDWYNANLMEIDKNVEIQERVTINTYRLLEIFEESNVKATFFVLASIAEKHPNLILEIKKKGHEIASHGYGHELIYSQSKEQFREDIKNSKKILEDIIDEPILGYRAPSWSITEKSLWALEILQQEGFKYDSSIFPFKNFLYGIKNAPRYAYNSNVYNKNSNLMEIPPSTIKFMKFNIPFSGGFYFRFLPYCIIDFFIKLINSYKQPVIVYIHPWEIDKNQPKLKLSPIAHFIQYYGIRRCEKKLKKLVKRYSFMTMRDYFFDNN